MVAIDVRILVRSQKSLCQEIVFEQLEGVLDQSISMIGVT